MFFCGSYSVYVTLAPILEGYKATVIETANPTGIPVPEYGSRENPVPFGERKTLALGENNNLVPSGPKQFDIAVTKWHGGREAWARIHQRYSLLDSPGPEQEFIVL